MRIKREGMEHEHGVARGRVELSPGLVGHVDRAQTPPCFEMQAVLVGQTGETPVPGVVADAPRAGCSDPLS
jgi:hypothetical protein